MQTTFNRYEYALLFAAPKRFVSRTLQDVRKADKKDVHFLHPLASFERRITAQPVNCGRCGRRHPGRCGLD